MRESLAIEYPKQQKRCRQLLHAYGERGPMMIEAVLQRADKASAEGDVVAMLRCYEEMKGCS